MSDDIIEAGGDGEILDEQADERAESESIEVGVWVFTPADSE